MMRLQEQIEFIDNLAREYMAKVVMVDEKTTKQQAIAELNRNREIANRLNECRLSLKFLEDIQIIVNNHVK